MLKALHNPRCSYRPRRNVWTIFSTFSFCYPPKSILLSLKITCYPNHLYVLQHKSRAFVQERKRFCPKKHVLQHISWPTSIFCRTTGAREGKAGQHPAIPAARSGKSGGNKKSRAHRHPAFTLLYIEEIAFIYRGDYLYIWKRLLLYIEEITFPESAPASQPGSRRTSSRTECTHVHRANAASAK